jgi:hypothetical protein
VVTLAGGPGRPDPFHNDDGSAQPDVTAALRAYAAGLSSERAVLTAVSRSRLLVPVVAVPAEDAGPGAGGAEKVSEMALPNLVGRDGRLAIPAFTCVDSLAMWRQDARPAPAAACEVWRAAAEAQSAVVIDIAGPVPLTVDGARLAALAGGEEAPWPHQDRDVLTAVRAATAGQAGIFGVALIPGDDTAGEDLVVELQVAPGPAVARLTRQAGARVAAALSERLRRGITVRAVIG